MSTLLRKIRRIRVDKKQITVNKTNRKTSFNKKSEITFFSRKGDLFCRSVVSKLIVHFH